MNTGVGARRRLWIGPPALVLSLLPIIMGPCPMLVKARLWRFPR
jgi:hypothetical protein